jgi:hypothetical protein
MALSELRKNGLSTYAKALRVTRVTLVLKDRRVSKAFRVSKESKESKEFRVHRGPRVIRAMLLKLRLLPTPIIKGLSLHFGLLCTI